MYIHKFLRNKNFVNPIKHAQTKIYSAMLFCFQKGECILISAHSNFVVLDSFVKYYEEILSCEDLYVYDI